MKVSGVIFTRRLYDVFYTVLHMSRRRLKKVLSTLRFRTNFVRLLYVMNTLKSVF